ncbi:thioredoxin domain-containing protein [Bythopirellula polymerisocia]|uniref:Glycosyl Hydrolase Family 88 n=1 Tax=Bythopirellula polymerisocia TaxID=2528003 RepID=A0A5C6CXW6_9BACT|nr:thioredoxin domain-containing protein [Bythopirellula polymerisocia]TWU27489.1 Glycosyl Hydrolase Family 88 [Bythopirellula polymerisocia]
MPNRLADETSPYLLQHKDNPVDWYPWGPEALERARREEKAIFLSIGYSACHWCHVMEHESFENEAIARSLNEKFVCIKVDREERPDLDQVYMNAVQMLTGRGGWPMSVFLTPDLKPFYGGTYWPPHAKQGMPGFDQVIDAVANAWNNNRDAAVETADRLTAELSRAAQTTAPEGEVTAAWITGAAAHFRHTYDSTYGGFGAAPKFPAPMSLRLLMRDWYRRQEKSSLEMVRGTLDRMAAGGIYDHLGGGFARYSVDERWLVPHFEKMLYDNAQLALAYLEAYQITGDEAYAQVVRETLDYVLRDMTDPAGGFYSSEDADSEGVEGKFYTWTQEQLNTVLDENAAATFAKVYDVTAAGNFEHSNILNLPKTIDQLANILGRDPADLRHELAASREKLFAAREERIHPHKDDKVLVAWNGLMIEALAAAGAVLGEKKYLAAAEKAADFLLSELRDADGRLLHTWRDGQAKVSAYLDDYSYLANGLITLYEATFMARYLEEAITLMDVVLERFADEGEGGFFFTADDQEQLLVRNKDFTDNAVPSGNAMAACALVKLGKLTGSERYLTVATRTVQTPAELVKRYPSATAQTLLAVDLLVGPTYEMVLAADLESEESEHVLSEIHSRFLPNKVLAFATEEPLLQLAELLRGKTVLGDAPTLYICEGFTCQAPAQGKEEILHALGDLAANTNELRLPTK